MEELFAMEELAPEQIQNVQDFQNLHLMEIQSIEDPVLIQDSRVLNNLIQSQNHPTTKFAAPGNLDYFQLIQPEIKPHMRKIGELY